MLPKVAVIGNPNVGKTLVFNSLTGERQHVGNWPGVTVEKKEGTMKYRGNEYRIVDLPGTYSLTARAVDEKVSRDFILYEKPDLVVNILDASNLERNLYLTVLLMEMNAPLLIALNMMDCAADKGCVIDAKKLSDALGIPVIPMVASKDSGIGELKAAIAEAVNGPRKEYSKPAYVGASGYEAEIEKLIKDDPELAAKAPPGWLAVKTLERDEEVMAMVRASTKNEAIMGTLKGFERDGGDLDLLMADARYGYIAGLIPRVMVKKEKRRLTTSDMLDRVLLDRVLAIPIFLMVMWAVFQFTFVCSAPFMDAIDLAFVWLGGAVDGLIPNEWLNSLVVDGLIGGWGFILVFIPPIMFMFLSLSFLEDSGYLARAAFIMDRVMYRLGLHGRSFIPMLMGFGCNVPAIMATRSIESPKDRLVTILVNPLMSCGARLPVYVLLAGAFFGAMSGAAIFGIYMLGIVLAAVMALLFRKFLFPGKPAPFILELPLYQVPTIKSTVLHMWNNVWAFIKRASTILLVGALVIWFISSHPWGVESIEDSYAGALGKLLEPLFSPLGFDWKANVALISGLLAKEVVVGTFGILYGAGEDESAISGMISGQMTPLTAFALMAFVLIYMPCVAVIGTIKKETGSWKWTAFAIGYGVVLAYVVALAIKVVGSLLGFN